MEVIGYDAAGKPGRVPHRLDRLFGSTKATLHFVMPDHAARRSRCISTRWSRGSGSRSGILAWWATATGSAKICQRREIGASHFDQFVDFDGDGDLDLFKGGVEPFVYCYENVGGNRLVDRGRLRSGGETVDAAVQQSQPELDDGGVWRSWTATAIRIFAQLWRRSGSRDDRVLPQHDPRARRPTDVQPRRAAANGVGRSAGRRRAGGRMVSVRSRS